MDNVMENTQATVSQQKATKTRYNFIDVLRVIACFLVIVNHTNSWIFTETIPTPCVTWYVSLTYFFISKIAVPIFIMISGYTMLDRIDSYKKIGQKVFRAVAALYLFSIPYYLGQWQVGHRPFISVGDFIVSVFQLPQTTAFWYMYMYIGLLVMLPFLQKMVANLSKKDVEIFIALCLIITGTWPILEHWFPILTYSKLVDFALFDSFVGILMLGYYMKKYVTPSKKKLIASVIVFVSCVAFNVIMTRHEYDITGGINYLFYDDRVYLPIVMASAAVFYMVSQMKVEGLFAKIMKVLGGCSFGIYLLADFLLGRLQEIWFMMWTRGMHQFVAIVIYEFMIFGLAFIITFVLRLIPGVKKVV